MIWVLAGLVVVACAIAYMKISRTLGGELRLDILRLKCTGGIPLLTWGDVAHMLTHSCANWPAAEKLAVPKSKTEKPHDPVTFETPVGDIRWEAWTRQAVGVLILDEMRGVYERGDVYLKPGDVVIDLGANVGTFTRFALSRGRL